VDGVQWEIAHGEATTEHEVLAIGMRAKTKYRIRAISGLAEAEATFTTGALPAHIPVAEVDMNDAARVQPGWTLMNVQRGDGTAKPASNSPPTAVAYDAEGYPVWYFVNGNMSGLRHLPRRARVSAAAGATHREVRPVIRVEPLAPYSRKRRN
jgi:hypothetical protein